MVKASMWTPINEDVTHRGKSAYRFYRCNCGTEWWVRVQSVKSGASTNCGCNRAKLAGERLVERHKQGLVAPGPGRPRGRVSLEVEYRYWSVSKQKWGPWEFYAKVAPSKVQEILSKSNADLDYRVKPT